MSTHLPVDPADPNRGGIPLRDDDGKWIGIVVDDPYVAGKLPPDIAARLTTIGAMLWPPEPRVHPDDHPSTREAWPGQHEHHRQHDLMLAEHATTGVYRDPVSGREFPPGGVMLRDPNREQRRRLAAWRASGKVRR